FLPEARSTDLAREFGREQFYDDLPVERRLSREEETTHAAAAELALDVVGVAEDTLQASLEIGHAVSQVVRQLHHRGHGQTRPEGRASVSHFRPVERSSTSSAGVPLAVEVADKNDPRSVSASNGATAGSGSPARRYAACASKTSAMRQAELSRSRAPAPGQHKQTI